MTNTATPAEWPEVRAGARSAIVCGGCHASLDQLVTNGHIGDCDHPDRHQHHVTAPVEGCLWYREWQRGRARRRRLAVASGAAA